MCVFGVLDVFDCTPTEPHGLTTLLYRRQPPPWGHCVRLATLRLSPSPQGGFFKDVALFQFTETFLHSPFGNSFTTANDAQSDIPIGLSGVIAISEGKDFALALKSDGTVVAWGDNSKGQCKVPHGLTGVIAIAAGGFHSLALKSDGTVVTWGDNSYRQTTVPLGLTGIKSVAAGRYHSMASLEGVGGSQTSGGRRSSSGVGKTPPPPRVAPAPRVGVGSKSGATSVVSRSAPVPRAAPVPRN